MQTSQHLKEMTEQRGSIT